MMASIGSAGKAMARPWSRRGRRRRRCRPGRAAGVIGTAAGLALALAACMSAQPSSTATAAGSQTAIPPGMSCAWPDVLSAQTDNTGLANADTSYVLAYLVRPPAADVVLVTAKAPTFPPGSYPAPWPARGEDVRYWSMCIGLLAPPTPVVANKLPGGGTDYGCRADEATRLNAAGDYTYVATLTAHGPQACLR